MKKHPFQEHHKVPLLCNACRWR